MTIRFPWISSAPLKLPRKTNYMANTKSAQKRARQSLKRASANRVIKSSVKTARKALNTAISAGSKEDAENSLRQLTSFADKAAKKGAIHKNSASRLKALYSQRVSGIS